MNEKVLGCLFADGEKLYSPKFKNKKIVSTKHTHYRINKNKLVPVVLKKDYNKLKSSKGVPIKEIKYVIKRLKQAVDETDFICSNTPVKVYKEALRNFLFIITELRKDDKKGVKK